MVFLELLVLVTVEIVFFQFHIIVVVFLILKVTFFEKFCLLCSLVSYLNDIILNCAKICAVHK